MQNRHVKLHFPGIEVYTDVYISKYIHTEREEEERERERDFTLVS